MVSSTLHNKYFLTPSSTYKRKIGSALNIPSNSQFVDCQTNIFDPKLYPLEKLKKQQLPNLSTCLSALINNLGNLICMYLQLKYS